MKVVRLYYGRLPVEIASWGPDFYIVFGKKHLPEFLDSSGFLDFASTPDLSPSQSDIFKSNRSVKVKLDNADLISRPIAIPESHGDFDISGSNDAVSLPADIIETLQNILIDGVANARVSSSAQASSDHTHVVDFDSGNTTLRDPWYVVAESDGDVDLTASDIIELAADNTTVSGSSGVVNISSEIAVDTWLAPIQQDTLLYVRSVGSASQTGRTVYIGEEYGD